MSADAIRIETAQDIRDLEAPWTEIQAAGGVAHPMCSWEWLSTWWEAFGEGRELVAVVAYDDAGPAAIAAFVARSARMNRLFRFRRLELLGTGEPEHEEVYSEYLDFPVRPGTDESVLDAIAEAVLAFDGPARWDDLILHRTQPESAAHRAFMRIGAQRGCLMTRLSQGRCPYIRLPASMDEYDRFLGRKKRYKLRRSRKPLEAMGPITFEKAETEEEALATLDVLAGLHQERWTAKGRPGVFSSQRFTDFHRRFIGRSFAKGWPELWTLKVGGQPIASHYNLRHGDRIFHYQPGMKLFEDRRIQPGTLAHYYGIERAIRSGAREYDFMLGEQSYKLSLSNASRELVTVRICRSSPKETARGAVAGAVRLARKVRPGGRGGATR